MDEKAVVEQIRECCRNLELLAKECRDNKIEVKIYSHDSQGTENNILWLQHSYGFEIKALVEL
jgi:hypothetical protein